MKSVVVKTTFENLVSKGLAKINAKGKVIINRKYFNSLERYQKVAFKCSVRALERSLMRDKILPKNAIGNNHTLPPNVVVDKNNNVIDPTTMSKRRYGTYKAHMTIRAKKAGLSCAKINETTKFKNYNRPQKRAFVKQFEKRCIKYGSGEILALESPDLLVAKALPNHIFTIYEHDSNIIKAIRKNVKTVSNIKELIKGDISKVPRNKYFDYAFPDFCNTYKTNEHRIKLLAKRLHDTKVIGFTFAFRGHGFTDDDGDPQFATEMRLMNIFKNHVIDHCKTYKDGSPMYGIILKRKDLE